MNIQLIETAKTQGSVLSIGAFFVKSALERAGHRVTIQDAPKDGFDCEMFSVHHVTDFRAVVSLPKKSPLRICGGHALYTNPRPLIPFSDYLFLGEWDSGLSKISECLYHPSVIDCRRWKVGQPITSARVETTLPPLIPYLNHDETNSIAYYLEIARGCPFACHYCELGHSVPYRRYDKREIMDAIDQCDLTRTRKINFFAPDEASHPDYAELLDYVLSKGAFPSGFASMRVDTVRKLSTLRKNTLIRCGVDGLTEATRLRVGKKITNQMLVEHFQRLAQEGHTNFKMFMIFGYEWETLSDFDEFEKTMRRIFALPLKKNVSLRIKWTPFIPQPSTPLAQSTARYDMEMVKRIERFHLLFARPKRTPGFFVENDGLMSEKSHRQQCELNFADEGYFHEFQSYIFS